MKILSVLIEVMDLLGTNLICSPAIVTNSDSPDNVFHNRAGHTSEGVKTRPLRVVWLSPLNTLHFLVAMPSQTEERLCLTLQAYTSGQISSFVL